MRQRRVEPRKRSVAGSLIVFVVAAAGVYAWIGGLARRDRLAPVGVRRAGPVRSRASRPAAVAVPSPPWVALVVLAVLAALVWLNAIVNRYRFNVAVAVLATIPLLVIVALAATRRRS